MICRIQNGRCVNCGETDPAGECSAEVDITELLAMRDGKTPERCVLMTRVQLERWLQPRGPCKHLGLETGTEKCPTCPGNVRVKLFECSVHHRCTLLTVLSDQLACCHRCRDFDAA